MNIENKEDSTREIEVLPTEKQDLSILGKELLPKKETLSFQLGKGDPCRKGYAYNYLR
jgi:hypothetical protein